MKSNFSLPRSLDSKDEGRYSRFVLYFPDGVRSLEP